MTVAGGMVSLMQFLKTIWKINCAGLCICKALVIQPKIASITLSTVGVLEDKACMLVHVHGVILTFKLGVDRKI